MRYDRVLVLLKESIVEDAVGNQIPIETPKSVFCSVKSIGRTEFYAASSTGLKPELVFSIYESEYGNESKLKFNGQRYSIIRTYTTGNKEIELVCERKIGNGGD